MVGASRRGIPCGVYHYLCARTEEEAVSEARYFVNLIRPYKSSISLWAAADVEEKKYLPSDKTKLTRIVFAFCKVVKSAGFKPMVYTNPDFLTYRLNDISHWDLWLAYWGVKESSAKRYNPKIWQYGLDDFQGISGKADANIGFFDTGSEASEKSSVSNVKASESGQALERGAKVRVRNNLVYGTQNRFVTYVDEYDVLDVRGDRVVIGIIGKNGNRDLITAAVRKGDVEPI